MRTTISLDDRLGAAAKRKAAAEGLSLSAYIARALEAAMTSRPAPRPAPAFVLVTAGDGGPQPGVDLDRTSQLLVDDDERGPRG